MPEFNKYENGLSRRTRPQDQPKGTYPFAKNGVKLLDGVNQNEPGFILSSALIPYTPIGVIESDKFPIIFSTDNTNSALGYYDSDNDTYIPIANDALYSYKLGFNTNYPINGQAQRNYKGELVVGFTDWNTFPKFQNCDVPQVASIDDWRLFPLANIPVIATSTIDGGVLQPGAYYGFVKCVKNDGTETRFLGSSDAIILSGTANTNTGKAIQFDITNLDPDFNLVQLGIISKLSGITSSFTLEPVSIGTGNKVSIIYTGSNITTNILLEELLVEPVIYSKVRTIGQLNDAIYLGHLEKEPEINLQKEMLLARIEWVSKLITVSPVTESHSSGKERSLMHFEVYSFYIRLSKTGGAGWTQLFAIPGPEPISSDFNQSSEATYGGGLIAKNFQVEDTIRVFNATAKTGTCGVWVNDSETYPNTDDYDASAIGGRDLRNKFVLHHRMPSIRWCKENLYANNSNYGKNELDLLGIRVFNIIIPQQYASQLDGGYEIYYAKRTIANSTVVGQSALMFAARHGSGAGTTTISGPDTAYKTTGGNWHAQVDWDNSSREKPLVIDNNLFRFHAFDLLFNQPSINPLFIRQELFLTRMNMPMIEDYTLTGGKRDAPIAYLVDYLQDGSPPIVSASGTIIRKIETAQADKTQYAPCNIISGKWHNIMAETAFVGKIVGPGLINRGNDISYSNLFTGPPGERSEEAAQFEKCYLTNLMNLPANLYLPFNSQPVVRMAPRQAPGTNNVMFGGDVFICDYTFNTYGWHDYQNSTYSRDGSRDPYMGIKAARRILCESASNIYKRYETPGNIYSKWYPNSPLVKDDNSNYLTLFDRRIDPNQFGYNRDSNSLNDLTTAVIFNPLKEDIRFFPFRVHRGGRLNTQLKKRSWRTFRPLDFYDCQRNMGVISHLEGMDDRLLIHMENAMFYTNPKLNLQQDNLSVVIGNGDIFQFEPQEVYSDKLGYAGSIHNLACVRTPAGYVFVDVGHGEVFLFKGQLKLITAGLEPFLLDHLRVKENNPFIGNGITVGYDQEYKRILLTCKNLIKPVGVKEFVKTQAFIDSLTPGESLVTDSGRLMRFLGISDIYSCIQPINVQVGDVVLTIGEDTPIGTIIHTIIPISGVDLSYYILSGNLDDAFSLEAATGNLKVANQAAIAYQVRQQLILQVKALSSNGLSDTFTITVNITAINNPPVSGDQIFTIPENSANATLVGTIPATDPEGAPLSFSIVSGNTEGVFVLNSVTGKLTVANSTLLDFETNPLYLLIVAISDGVNTITIQVTVNITDVDEPPPLNDDTINIYDTTPTDTIVYQFSAEDPEGGLVTYEIVNASTPGVFSLDPTTGEIKLVNNSYLNPATTPQYTITVRAVDNNQNSDDGTLTINVLFDMEFIQFRPSSPSCSGGCPDGYTATTDGLYCEKFTTIAATPPSGGPPFDVVSAVDDSYSNFGALVYQPGYDGHGVGTIAQWLQSSVWRNPSANLIDGALNRCGVWAAGGAPDNEAIGFSVPIVLTTAATVYVGIAGDNKCKIAINGQVLVDQDPVQISSSVESQLPIFAGQGISLAFKFWHIYPFQLQAGTHYIGVEGVNYGGPAGFGAEIYANTVTELMNAQLEAAYISDPGSFPINQNHYDNLDLLFSTRSTRGGTFDSGISGGYSCPVNYAMDGSVSPPTCVLVERVASTTRIWAATQVYSIRNNQVVATLNNTAGQTYQGVPVPYYPPVNDHIDCGGATTIYYNVPKVASIAKNDCVGTSGSIVKYAVPGGMYTSTVSQNAANDLAQTDVDTNKQQYANDNGYCINH